MDTERFAREARACERAMYHTARCMLPSEADCEDAVQSALFKAWRNIGSLRDDSRFKTWLTRILINECKEQLRKKSRRAETALEDDLPAPGASGAYALEALGKLDAKYRLPLILNCLDGFSMEDIAKMLNLPRGAVRWRVSKAKKLLGEALKKGEAIT